MAVGQVIELPEVVPPGVREVLVEDDPAGPLRPRHRPAVGLAEQAEADVADESMVDVPADAERHVHPLRLEPDHLASDELVRLDVVGSRRAEQLVVALVAAEDRVGQVEEDDRRLGEVGVPLVLEASPGHEVAAGRRVDDLDGQDRSPGSADRR